MQETTERTSIDVGILGAGSAGEALAAELASTGLDVVVFESHRVGGECPFVACVPGKAMLHDAAAGTPWSDSVERRDDIVNHLDDSDHVDQLEDHGARLVRSAARIAGPATIVADDRVYDVGHIVIATGATPTIPPIDGLDDDLDQVWTSDDALVTDERPARLVIIGGGPIGCELAQTFAGFGTAVHLVDMAPRAFPDLPEKVGAIIDDGLRASGVSISRGHEVQRVERSEGSMICHLDDGTSIEADRVLVASGRHPRTTDIGLDTLGLDPHEDLPLGPAGRVECPGSVWAIGDVAAQGQYTHLANHQASVVADHLIGSGTRRFGDVVLPACVYTHPPLMTVGPNPDELDDADVVWVEAQLSDIARFTTDDLGPGHLSVAVDRETRSVVAAHGAGARFDELSAPFVTAIDAGTPVDRLVRSMMPFPTVSELLTVVYERAIEALDG